MIPAPELQVDIFVTNVKYAPKPAPDLQRVPSDNASLAPPAPQFARHGTPKGRPSSTASVDSDYESDAESFVDLSYYTGEFSEQDGELGHQEHVLDLTNFEGDDAAATGLAARCQLAEPEEEETREQERSLPTDADAGVFGPSRRTGS